MKPGLRRRALLGVVAAASSQAHAMWAPLRDAELLRDSDLIGLGMWLGQTQLQTGPQAAPLDLGVLQFSELWKGPLGLRLALVRSRAAQAPRSSSDLVFQPGQQGLWLLRLEPGAQGLYRCDHPQRFVPAGDARIELLRRLWQNPAG
ncbi:MAG: hypothetical protein U1E77_17030 [Inhella sp.]